MFRFLDYLFLLFSIVLLPLFLILAVANWLDKSLIFSQTRVGLGQKPFTLYKLRTMKLSTASVASHLVDANAITPFGRFLRKTKLDELPQLWNVLKGDMSLVGPRPCLPNQVELIEARAKQGVFSVRPGITGLAQINNIDMSTPELLAETDAEMIRTMSVKNYFRYLIKTVTGSGQGDAVKK